MSSIHILNGDALNECFPNDLKGERIIARACLVDGPVKAASLRCRYMEKLIDELAKGRKMDRILRKA